MTDLRKAAEMALAKLEHLWEIGIDAEYKVELLPEIEALRQALAQPEQEPTSVGMTCKVWTHGCALFDGIDLPNETLLYTAPPSKPWVGLTDDEIDELFQSPMSLEPSGELGWVRCIEAALKEKNHV